MYAKNRRIFFGLFVRIFALMAVLATVATNRAMAEEMELVSYTAYTSIYWLQDAGVPEAKEFSKAIGRNVYIARDSVKDYKRLVPVNRLYHEMRYTAINNYVVDKDYKNVMDIACGFSSRGIFLARQGRHFVGAEFKPIVMAAGNKIKACLTPEEQKSVSYEVVDATDKESMTAAADTMDGKICVVMDGLMMYLDREQQAATLQNIRDILKKHGGAYVTFDFSARDFVKESARVVYGNEDADEIYRESAKIYESISDADFEKSFFPNDEAATKFIEAQGLKVERRPVVENTDAVIYSAKKFNKGQKERLKDLEGKKLLWVITAK